MIEETVVEPGAAPEAPDTTIPPSQGVNEAGEGCTSEEVQKTPNKELKYCTLDFIEDPGTNIICIQESFNTNISHQLFDNKILCEFTTQGQQKLV